MQGNKFSLRITQQGLLQTRQALEEQGLHTYYQPSSAGGVINFLKNLSSVSQWEFLSEFGPYFKYMLEAGIFWKCASNHGWI